jgi:putative tricarboxylic transport membrane protein
MEYIDALSRGLTAVLSWPAFGLMLVGIGIGILVGLLPGLGSGFAFAVMLPFTFTMQPIEAFAFLLGMHAVTNLAGEITSVLFAVPGQGSAAAAILDGYPLAKQGQAARAIGANLFSSLVGGIFGAIVLAITIPIIRPFVLAFGNAELFMLCLLGVLFVASVAGKRLIPGILVAGIGFILALVGADPITGELRFTFGQLSLWEGVPLIPLVLGLFAVPELIDLSVRRSAISKNATALGGGLFQGVADTFRHWKLVLWSCVIGAVVGVIPGIGGSTAQWVAYGWARERSKNKELFGKGSIEGVLAPGAATNSKEGGDLIPTVVFGVPGGGGMALILAAFLIVGLVPGPKMLTENLHVTFSLVWIIIIAHIISVGICAAFLRQIVSISKIRATILIPFILALIILGAYIESGNISGVWITFAIGALGYVLVLLDWPRPPLVLAFVLGKLAENYLWLAQQVYGFAWLTRPIVVAVMLMMVAYIIYVYRSRKAEKIEDLLRDKAIAG